MKQHLKNTIWVKEAGHRKICAQWFHLHEVLEQTKLIVTEIKKWLPGKGHKEPFWGDGYGLCLI